MNQRFDDISSYYQRDGHAAQEEAAWIATEFYRRNAATVTKALATIPNPTPRVLEVCCGSGWIPTLLPEGVSYVGVDQTPEFVELARQKNVGRDAVFLLGDLREKLEPNTLGEFDLVIMFAALKHFGLHEWDEVLARVLRMAPRAVLDMQLSDQDRDNGSEFHHVFVTDEHMRAGIAANGHQVTQFWPTWTGEQAGFPVVETTFLTEKV